METTSDLEVGQVVKSKAGRDKGKVFVIYKILDEKYLLLIDGDMRKLKKPKKKKVKHVMIYNDIIEPLKEKIEKGEKFDNAYVRKQLEPYKNKE
ncbi:KOW domain-containing RNA-binding protein [Thermohalobacter berrensis]|uniref:50S ribosomal protein L14 n=1 Tax=Thermohalobacter berrensis TaxID=99594 RepID=A0A419T9J0_9FIRM|nr:KOW domain-containing RNA-binding protein [Thermohalobacter berrensis]RKD34135.1 hypothetical protein BET03_07545 [Thermohalobacter berrensis]